MGEQVPLFPKHKVIVTFPMWVLNNFENMERDAIRKSLMGFAKTYMDNEEFIKKHIVFEMVDGAEEEIDAMTDEEFSLNILISREYAEFVKTLTDSGIIPAPVDDPEDEEEK